MTSPASEAAPQGARDVAALQRRTLRVVVASQMLGGAGLAAGVTVGALLARDMLGSARLSGLPAALFTLGAASAALLVGRLSQRAGRRTGLAAGYAVGALGSALVVLAAVLDAVALLLPAFSIYGAGVATNLQSRYAGADLADPAHRGRAVSLILLATTAGAVAGPNLVDLTGELAERAGIPALAGPFALAAIAYGLAGLVLLVFLRPDPLLVARALAARAEPEAPPARRADPAPETGEAASAWDRAPAPLNRGVLVAAIAMILTQVVMVAVMTMTPIHMRDHGHGLGETGLVISIHIACMYLPSPLTGVLADRVGRRPVIAAGGATLLAAGLLAAVAPTGTVALLAVALGLLGLGWNLGLIGGTALVTDAAPPRTSARTQGSVDLAVSLAGAASGLSSGLIVASTSYALLAVAGGLLALLMLPLLLRADQARPAPGAA